MIVSPSILSADFLNLERDIVELEGAGADYIHIDIMDDVFTKNTTWGPPTVKAIRGITDLTLDVHLMIDRPERVIEDYLEAGADIVTIHPESTNFLRRTLLDIRRKGRRAGAALKLDTTTGTLKNSLDLLDVVLVLCCDEGFGGEPFNPIALKKIKELARMRKDYSLDFKIEVDGGINSETALLCKEVGADILVSGSYIFKGSMEEGIEKLRSI